MAWEPRRWWLYMLEDGTMQAAPYSPAWGGGGILVEEVRPSEFSALTTDSPRVARIVNSHGLCVLPGPFHRSIRLGAPGGVKRRFYRRLRGLRRLPTYPNQDAPNWGSLSALTKDSPRRVVSRLAEILGPESVYPEHAMAVVDRLVAEYKEQWG